MTPRGPAGPEDQKGRFTSFTLMESKHSIHKAMIRWSNLAWHFEVETTGIAITQHMPSGETAVWFHHRNLPAVISFLRRGLQEIREARNGTPERAG